MVTFKDICLFADFINSLPSEVKRTKPIGALEKITIPGEKYENSPEPNTFRVVVFTDLGTFYCSNRISNPNSDKYAKAKEVLYSFNPIMAKSITAHNGKIEIK